ncbi:alpha-L-rhamnosidase [Parapedobacter composti]|uniref:alpha-L-rhamnosidase n=2 Tax=Parapedobacter composti TaxID=623281 RepID=A0A1I1H5N5_9SPHI|nr:alpha-L-rhamnosidase [Parapedobacter composti]
MPPVNAFFAWSVIEPANPFKNDDTLKNENDFRLMKRLSFASILIGWLIAAGSSLSATAQDLSVAAPKCENLHNPLGIGVTEPRFSWKLSTESRGITQAAYEIKVAESPNALKQRGKLLWQSGKVQSDQSIHVPYGGPALQSRQRYFWQVRVWDNRGRVSPWSDVQHWEMGLLDTSLWNARWIRAAQTTDGKPVPSPVFRKAFTVEKEIADARLYVTAHGLYEVALNGQRVGDYYFTPGWTSYHKRLQYQVFDVKQHPRRGDNVTLVTLGDGWYRGRLFSRRNVYGKEHALLYQLEVRYKDGSMATVISDGTWKVTFDGPIQAADHYDGEVYDARKADSRWSAPAYDASRWENVIEQDISKANLVASNGVFVTKHEAVKPTRLIVTPKGEKVLDFGQNLVGWVKFTVAAQAGDTITLHHAEVLDSAGNFYTANLKDAKQEIVYICRGGGEETYEPHFTFHGFRYVRLQGYPGDVDIENFTAQVLHSDIPVTGKFQTSNPLLNQLQHNITWSQKGNFLDVPTDCPQRDERLGWTADAQVFFNTAAFNMDVSNFFAKWLADLRADQFKSGNMPVVVPNVRGGSGSAAWADAATIVPWNFFVNYADQRLLETQYESMKAWVEFMRKTSKNNLSTISSRYGDWLFYSPTDDRYGKAALTDKDLIAQAFYIYSTTLVAKAAERLGKESDYRVYQQLLPTLKQAFMDEFVTANGRLVSPTQTAYVLALHFDILPEELREQAARRLVENIESYDYHLTTGFVGTPYLNHVLTRFGYTDVAYKLLLYGDIHTAWQYTADRMEVSVTIPPNTSATVLLPQATLADVQESNQPLTAIKGLKDAAQSGDAVKLKLGSGTYTFVYKPNKK